MVSLIEPFGDVAADDRSKGRQVPVSDNPSAPITRPLFVHERRIIGQRLLEVGYGRKFFVLVLDRIDCRLRRCLVNSSHGSDHLALESHNILGEECPVSHGAEAFVRNIVLGEHSEDTGERAGRCDVEARDAGVRNPRVKELCRARPGE